MSTRRVLKKLLWLLGHLWALPVTLLGLLIALPFARLHSVDAEGLLHFVARPERWLGRYLRRSNILAFTLGATVTYADAGGLQQPTLVRHERAHVVQTLVLGPLFLPLYGLASLWQFVRGGHPYFDNVFERQAHAAEASARPPLRLVR